MIHCISRIMKIYSEKYCSSNEQTVQLYLRALDKYRDKMKRREQCRQSSVHF